MRAVSSCFRLTGCFRAALLGLRTCVVVLLLLALPFRARGAIACNCTAIGHSAVINTTRMLCPHYAACADAFELAPGALPDAVSFAFAFHGSTAARFPRLLDAARTCLGNECSREFTAVWMALVADGLRCESTHAYDPALGACVCASALCRNSATSAPALAASRPYDPALINVVVGALIAGFVVHVAVVQRTLGRLVDQVVAADGAKRK